MRHRRTKSRSQQQRSSQRQPLSSSKAAEGWRKEGLSPEDVDDLQELLGAIVSSLVEPNFDRYHKLMEKRGAKLDAAGAEALLKSLLKQYDAGPDILNDSVLNQLRYVWDNPGPRKAEWRFLSLEHVVCDSKYLAAMSNWPSLGISGQMTLYTPLPGAAGFRLFATVEEQGYPRARVRFPVELTTGEVVYAEFGFYKVQPEGAERAFWYPDRFMISNTTTLVEQRPKLLI